MSNQSDTTPYRRYFGGVIQKMGVLPVITEYGPKLYLDADVPFSPQGKNARARVRITLRLSTDKSYWVVSEFTVTSANPFWILWGSDFLEHYGKRPGNEEGDLARATDKVWVLRIARDLQALLKNYDQLAKELGKPTLFGH